MAMESLCLMLRKEHNNNQNFEVEKDPRLVMIKSEKP